MFKDVIRHPKYRMNDVKLFEGLKHHPDLTGLTRDWNPRAPLRFSEEITTLPASWQDDPISALQFRADISRYRTQCARALTGPSQACFAGGSYSKLWAFFYRKAPSSGGRLYRLVRLLAFRGVGFLGPQVSPGRPIRKNLGRPFRTN